MGPSINMYNGAIAPQQRFPAAGPYRPTTAYAGPQVGYSPAAPRPAYAPVNRVAPYFPPPIQMAPPPPVFSAPAYTAAASAGNGPFYNPAAQVMAGPGMPDTEGFDAQAIQELLSQAPASSSLEGNPAQSADQSAPEAQTAPPGAQKSSGGIVKMTAKLVGWALTALGGAALLNKFTGVIPVLNGPNDDLLPSNDPRVLSYSNDYKLRGKDGDEGRVLEITQKSKSEDGKETSTKLYLEPENNTLLDVDTDLEKIENTDEAPEEPAAEEENGDNKE